jgi:N-acetylmuramoyl-L-alanine amidase
MIIAAGDKKKFARMLPRLVPAQHGAPRSLLFFFFLFFSVFCFCMAVPEAVAASTSSVREISFTSDGSSEKVTIALSRPAAYKANFLNHNPKANVPYRLYFDLSNTVFAKGVNRHLKVQGDCVRVVRSALNRSRTVRVVLELKHKVNADDYKVIKRSNPPALEIILNSKKITARARKTAKQVPKSSSPKSVVTPAVQKPVQVAVPKKQPEKKEPRTYLIAVDAGHGGRDPGAVGYRGLKEKKVSLAIALALQKAIDKRPGYKAVMTRSKDTFLSLADRAKFAGEKKADLLISIHGNSHSDPRIAGIETYYLNFSSDDEARKVAARENFTTPEKVGDLEMILFDLMQSDKTNPSSLLAGYVQGNIKAVMAASRYKNFRNLGVKHAPMRVLVEAEMPGILIETGFISNAKESARLKNAAYQQLLAGAIADGIHEFLTSSKTAAYRK